MIDNRDNAERAISTMMQLLPEEHLMLASAQRVKALILEEIALDNIPGNSSETRKCFVFIIQFFVFYSYYSLNKEC